jgi:N-acetylglucosaminyl-diphospho-decaprenol L-rhamnosyltransferase
VTRFAKIDVVIVNWNSGQWLRRCIASIGEHGKDHVQKVIVVDNGSTDGSDAVGCPQVMLDIVRIGRNLGFGRACNLGAGRGRAPYILFLNPDASLLSSTLDTAVAFMDRPENAGVGVCGIKLIEDDGAVQRHCARLPTPAVFLAAASGLAAILPGRVPGLHDRDFDHLSSRPVDHVIGAFYLIRRPLFEQLGGFDERFFVYLEDLDLSARVHQAGHGITYLAEAVGLHHGGGTSEQVKPQRLAYALESRIVYAFKHFTVVPAFAVAIVTLCIEPFPRLLRAVRRRSLTDAKETGRGFMLLWRRVLRRAFDRSGPRPGDAQ